MIFISTARKEVLNSPHTELISIPTHPLVAQRQWNGNKKKLLQKKTKANTKTEKDPTCAVLSKIRHFVKVTSRISNMILRGGVATISRIIKINKISRIGKINRISNLNI